MVPGSQGALTLGGTDFSRAQKHKWFASSSTRGHLEADKITRTTAGNAGTSLMSLPCAGLGCSRYPTDISIWMCTEGMEVPAFTSKSLSLIYFAAQPLCFSSQFIKFYCITINMQNSYLKGIQKYNQKRE